jgi:hypothetical protein
MGSAVDASPNPPASAVSSSANAQLSRAALKDAALDGSLSDLAVLAAWRDRTVETPRLRRSITTRPQLLQLRL